MLRATDYPSDLAPLLRCPATRRPLRWADDAELAALASTIRAGTARHADGRPVSVPVDAALVVEGAPHVYAASGGVLLLLPAMAIHADAATRAAESLSPVKAAVQSFYDEVGWGPGEGDRFEDAARFEDLRPVAADYVRKCHERVSRHLPPRGRYLLDVASGPVQYDAYLDYSRHYDFRICVDLSVRALRQARERLGDRGIYVLGDVTALPFRDDCLDGVVSLHTVYHVPADEQATAVAEIRRVLAPGGRAVIVYSWGAHAVLPRILGLPVAAAGVARSLLSGVGRARGAGAGGHGAVAAPAAGPPLYFEPLDHAWMREQLRGAPAEILCWRSLGVPLTRFYARDRLLGRALLRAVFALEERFPGLMGRIGQYPLVTLAKGG